MISYEIIEAISKTLKNPMNKLNISFMYNNKYRFYSYKRNKQAMEYFNSFTNTDLSNMIERITILNKTDDEISMFIDLTELGYSRISLLFTLE